MATTAPTATRPSAKRAPRRPDPADAVASASAASGSGSAARDPSRPAARSRKVIAITGRFQTQSKAAATMNVPTPAIAAAA